MARTKLNYPESITWLIEVRTWPDEDDPVAADGDREVPEFKKYAPEDPTEIGTGVMIQLEQLTQDNQPKEPRDIRNYLLTCAHVVFTGRGDASRPGKEILCFNPKYGYRRTLPYNPNSGDGRRKRKMDGAHFASISKLSPTQDHSKPDLDWVLLKLEDIDDRPRVDKLDHVHAVKDPAAGDKAFALGFPKGAGFEKDRAASTQGVHFWGNDADMQATRTNNHRIVKVDADMVDFFGVVDSRAGMSGGGVFCGPEYKLVGLHRSRDDDAGKAQAISVQGILDWLLTHRHVRPVLPPPSVTPPEAPPAKVTPEGFQMRGTAYQSIPLGPILLIGILLILVLVVAGHFLKPTIVNENQNVFGNNASNITIYQDTRIDRENPKDVEKLNDLVLNDPSLKRKFEQLDQKVIDVILATLLTKDGITNADVLDLIISYEDINEAATQQWAESVPQPESIQDDEIHVGFKYPEKLTPEAVRFGFPNLGNVTRVRLGVGFDGDPKILSGLAKFELKEVDFTGSKISDIGPMCEGKLADSLVSLDLRDTIVDDVEPLSRLTSLEGLTLGHTKISNDTVLRSKTGFFPGIENLKTLSLHSTELTDLRLLEPLKNLKTLDLRGVDCQSLVGLEKLHNLKDLQLWRVPVSNLKPLDNLSLERLSIIKANVGSLEPLRSHSELKYLDVTDNPITDLSPLRNKLIETLNLWGTDVRDIEPLSTLPLVSLSLGKTKVEDLSPLYGVTSLKFLNIKRLSDVQWTAKKTSKYPYILYENPESVLDLVPKLDFPDALASTVVNSVSFGKQPQGGGEACEFPILTQRTSGTERTFQIDFEKPTSGRVCLLVNGISYNGETASQNEIHHADATSKWPGSKLAFAKNKKKYPALKQPIIVQAYGEDETLLEEITMNQKQEFSNFKNKYSFKQNRNMVVFDLGERHARQLRFHMKDELKDFFGFYRVQIFHEDETRESGHVRFEFDGSDDALKNHIERVGCPLSIVGQCDAFPGEALLPIGYAAELGFSRTDRTLSIGETRADRVCLLVRGIYIFSAVAPMYPAHWGGSAGYQDVLYRYDHFGSMREIYPISEAREIRRSNQSRNWDFEIWYFDETGKPDKIEYDAMPTGMPYEYLVSFDNPKKKNPKIKNDNLLYLYLNDSEPEVTFDNSGAFHVQLIEVEEEILEKLELD